jgi:GxxExxY protein
MLEEETTKEVIGSAIEVHRHLGPGLLESVYEDCLAMELGFEDCSTSANGRLHSNTKVDELE